MTEPTEKLLARLRPAAPSADLVARLRAARPTRGLRVQGSGKIPWRRVGWIAGLGAAAAVVIVNQASVPRAHVVATADATAAKPVAKPTDRESSQVFLPVESKRTLISVQPARLIQQPDQPPQRFVRAIWVDDLTAVGADTDAALHLRSAHEAYVPVSSPVY